MGTTPFPSTGSDHRITGGHEDDGVDESPTSAMPCFSPLFEVKTLKDYRELQNTNSDLILGATVFTSAPREIAELFPYEIISSLNPVETEPWVELYRFPKVSSAPIIIRDLYPELRVSHTGNFAFGHWEAELPSSGLVEETTLRAYRTILKALQGLGDFHLWRCWNVIPNIHERQGDLDHYMQFCLGRHRALITEEKLSSNLLPAASAVGSRGNRIQISFIAGKEEGETFENPDQISAYSYPRRYGPASPSFSRSLVAGEHLWLSGTASIAGHRSLHPDDLSAQVHETASRIETLVSSVEDDRRPGMRSLKALKVFLRHRNTEKELRTILRSAFPEETSYHIVEADICREDLLIEIEGVTT